MPIASGTAIMTKLLRALAALVIGLQGLLWLGIPVSAQSWASKPIRIIVPFPPGGTTDQIARRGPTFLQAELQTTVMNEEPRGASGAAWQPAAGPSGTHRTPLLLAVDIHR